MIGRREPREANAKRSMVDSPRLEATNTELIKKKKTHTEVPEREDGIECENPSGTCLLSVEER